MIQYFVDKTPLADGEYMLHQEQCQYIPSRSHRIFIGSFADERAAILKAESMYPHIHLCPNCCIHFSAPLKAQAANAR